MCIRLPSKLESVCCCLRKGNMGFPQCRHCTVKIFNEQLKANVRNDSTCLSASSKCSKRIFNKRHEAMETISNCIHFPANQNIDPEKQAQILLDQAKRMGCEKNLRCLVDAADNQTPVTPKDWLRMQHTLGISQTKVKSLYMYLKTTIFSMKQASGTQAEVNIRQFRDSLKCPAIQPVLSVLKDLGVSEKERRLIGTDARAINIRQGVQMLLECANLQNLLDFEYWNNKIVIVLSMDGVETTPTRSIELALLGLHNLRSLNSSPEAFLPVMVSADIKENPKTAKLVQMAMGIQDQELTKKNPHLTWNCPGKNCAACSSNPPIASESFLDDNNKEVRIHSAPIVIFSVNDFKAAGAMMNGQSQTITLPIFIVVRLFLI